MARLLTSRPVTYLELSPLLVFRLLASRASPNLFLPCGRSPGSNPVYLACARSSSASSQKLTPFPPGLPAASDLW